MRTIITTTLVLTTCLVLRPLVPTQARAGEVLDRYAVEVSRDKPVAWWRFNQVVGPFASRGDTQLLARPTQSVQAGVA